MTQVRINVYKVNSVPWDFCDTCEEFKEHWLRGSVQTQFMRELTTHFKLSHKIELVKE